MLRSNQKTWSDFFDRKSESSGGSGTLSMNGLGWLEGKDEKPGLLNQAVDWVTKKAAEVKAKVTSKPVSVTLATKATEDEKHSSKVISMDQGGQMMGNLAMKPQLATEAPLKKPNSSLSVAWKNPNAPSTDLAEFRRLVSEITSKSNRQEREELFQRYQPQLSQLQLSLSKNKTSRAEVMKILGGVSVPDRIGKEVMHGAVFDFPKFIVAGMLANLVISARDPNVPPESLIETIQRLPESFVNNFMFAMGSSVGTTLFDVMTPMVSQKLAQAYQLQTISRVMAESKNLTLLDAVASKSTATEIFRGQMGMLAGTIVTLALGEGKHMSMDQFFGEVIKTQLSFLMAQGLVQGLAIPALTAAVGEVMQGIRIGARGNWISAVVIFATELVFQNRIKRWMDLETQNASLNIELGDVLLRWTRNHNQQDYEATFGHLQTYWNIIVARDVQHVFQKYTKIQNKADEGYDMAHLRSDEKGSPRVWASQRTLNNAARIQAYNDEALRTEQALLATINPRVLRGIRWVREAEKEAATLMQTCTFETCQQEILQKLDAISFRKRVLLNEGGRLVKNAADIGPSTALTPITALMSIRILPKKMTADEWVKLTLALAKDTYDDQREQLIQLVMNIVEGNMHAYPTDFSHTGVEYVNGYYGSQLEPYNQKISGGSDFYSMQASMNNLNNENQAMTLMVPSDLNQGQIEQEVFTTLMKLARFQQCNHKSKIGNISNFVEGEQKSKSKREQQEEQSQRQNIINGMEKDGHAWLFIKDETLQGKHTEHDALIQVNQTIDNPRVGASPYVHYLYTVPVQNKMVQMYQQYVTCH